MSIFMSASAVMALKLLLYMFFLIYPTMFLNTVSSSSTSRISYSDHCASIVPESTSIQNHVSISPRPRVQYGYLYLGDGNGVLSRNTCFHGPKLVSFYTEYVYATDMQDLFHVDGTLTLHGPSTDYYHDSGSMYYGPGDPRRWGSFTFRLNGIWSVSSGKLCMVESGYNNYTDKGSLVLDLPAVFKLHNLKNSTSLRSLVTGTLESLISSDDPDYFEPISMFMFPQMNYDSAKNCTPFGASIDFLPSVMIFGGIGCSVDEQRFRVLIDFLATEDDLSVPFNPNTTLIGEGLWDTKTNQLYVVACRFLDATDSLAEAHLGDCSTRLSLRFPAIWTIRNTDSIVGHIWSNKSMGELGYFDKIKFQSSEQLMVEEPGFKYKYTELGKVKKLWPIKKSAKHKGNAYPNAFSVPKMVLYISVENAERKLALGRSFPLFVGNHYVPHLYSNLPLINSSFTKTGPIGISYKMILSLLPDVKLGSGFSLFSNSSNFLEITAEGIYDDTTGSLCMLACRYLGLDSQLSMDDYLDCEIRINIQFSARNTDHNSGYFKGSIESTRQNFDPLHFNRLELLTLSDTSNSAFCDCNLCNCHLSLLPNVKLDSAASLFSNSSNFTEITAEGIYDDTAGSLCLVGCRKIGLDSQLSMDDSLDCGILIFNFSPRNTDDNSGYSREVLKVLHKTLILFILII
ncbi:hypothetical protein FEM48_Zijuj12G0101900 [Ziziphus jujuba var. spinosa]|uniref:DUF2921 domain-containing protein n=1 Tax=Ziziphus jujuba var. spinosa TaxID=714518 RepID=A0A978UCQ3_ZIZJJ|nr:hypothetical protein FEM48_Zijuj12G0101900 [Ziziphus jujuba var. spinosa]